MLSATRPSELIDLQDWISAQPTQDHYSLLFQNVNGSPNAHICVFGFREFFFVFLSHQAKQSSGSLPPTTNMVAHRPDQRRMRSSSQVDEPEVAEVRRLSM
jgi:hypothetical protein